MNTERIMKNYLLSFILCWTSYCLSETTVDPRSLPRFLDQVPNITKTVGRDALLTCNVDQLKGYKVAWVQVDTQTILTIHKQVITRNPRISLLHDDHRSWHLQIKNLQEDDRGFYMCQVNTDPMRSIKGYLDVVVPPDIIDKESSGDLIVLEGEDVTLKCKAKGHPEPSIVWRRENNEEIVLDDNKSSGIHKVPKFEGEILVMKEVSRLQMGSYLCIASNNVPPSISKRIHLKIHFPPVAWVPQQLEGAYVGQELVIKCHTEAYPMSINYWTNNNGDMIVTGERLEATVTKESYKAFMTLRIKSVLPEDFGVFRCIAKNSLGETDGAIKVYELEPPPTYNTNLQEYENEVPEKEIGGIQGGLSTTTQKQRNKMEEVRKGINEITDPNQLEKDLRKGKSHSQNGSRRHPTNSLFGTPNSRAPHLCDKIHLSVGLISNLLISAYWNFQTEI